MAKNLASRAVLAKNPTCACYLQSSASTMFVTSTYHNMEGAQLHSQESSFRSCPPCGESRRKPLVFTYTTNYPKRHTKQCRPGERHHSIGRTQTS